MRRLVICLALLLSACAAKQVVVDDVPATPTACRVDTDCAVKDVGSCCGHHSQCVNIAHTPDPAAVRAACESEGRSSICGFPEIAGCRCVDGECAASGEGSSLQ